MAPFPGNGAGGENRTRTGLTPPDFESVETITLDLPKITILLGAFVEIECGNIKMDDETRAVLTRMIRNSSNRDATEVLMRVGMPNLAEILQYDRYRLYDKKHNGGL